MKCCIKRQDSGSTSINTFLYLNTRSNHGRFTSTKQNRQPWGPVHFSKHLELRAPCNNQLISLRTQHKAHHDISLLRFQQNCKLRLLTDGNCYFRFLSCYMYLFQPQQHHLHVRKEIMEFISDHACAPVSVATSQWRHNVHPPWSPEMCLKNWQFEFHRSRSKQQWACM